MSAPLLGIERSFGGRRWIARPTDERLGLALAQRCGVPDMVGRAMAARGVTLDDAEGYLSPTLRGLLPDPSSLKDMDAAAERLARAVRDGESVAIFGDYDVDGATSSAFLGRYLAALGLQARIYIPDRLAEGYGPNAPAMRRLAADGAKLIVTVDCGVAAFDALEAAAEAGADVAVLDHHVADARLPRAVAVVNPNRLDETTPHRYLAAVGVCFLAAVATNRVLRRAGFFADRPEPPLLEWLDLVALGTICDVAPLKGLNRAFAAQGLKVMARRGNAGIAALSDVARVDEAPTAYHAGFILGPRVNAGGRVGECGLGARLLLTDDPGEAAEIARRLDAFNEERRMIEAAVLDEALAQIEAGAMRARRFVLVAGASWHPGVVGIVASRLKERYARPAVVIGVEHGLGKGSGRSTREVDLGAAVIAARQAGILVAGGGHKMAAGLTVAEERIPELTEFLDERIAAQLEGEDIVPTMELDGVLSVGGASVELIESLRRLAPFGAGNAEPRFAISNARLVDVGVVGKDGAHVRCVFADAEGRRLKGIAFRAADSELGRNLLASRGLPVHAAGVLRVDAWNGGATPQIILDDAATPWATDAARVDDSELAFGR